MMRQLHRIRAVLVVAVKRLLAQPLLSSATMIGLTVAVALVLTIPIYAESVAFRVLTERLTEGPDRINRPPFSFLFSYIGSWNKPVNWEAIADLDSYLREKGGAELGLQTTRLVRHLETQNFRLYPAGETNYRDENRSLDYVSFGTTEDIESQVEVVEGSYPAAAPPDPNSIVEAMIHEEFASEFGIQAGERFVGYNWRLDAEDPMQIIDIHISGVWRPRDEDDEYWFYRPNVFADILLINEGSYANRLAPYTEHEINLAVWYLVTDGSSINTSRVDELIRRHDETEKIANQYLSGTYIQASPVDELSYYRRVMTIMTLTLTVFSIPIVALLIVFLIMLVGLVVDGQRNETAVMRSRGASPFQVVGLTMVEGLIMGLVALAVGGALALAFTRLIGTTRSFMDFRWGEAFVVSTPPGIGTAFGLALLFTVLIRVVPTIGAARHTIISYKMDRARLLDKPLWQRAGLDLLLLGLIGYFYYQVAQQGSLIDVEGGAGNISQAYEQPFVFLLPPLTIFAVTLFALRFLAPILRFLAWIIQWTNSVGLLMVTRQLERAPGTYYLPLILLVCTISLGIYTASFARTIDRYLYEQQYYRISADLSVRVYSQTPGGFPGASANDAPPAYMHISEFTAMPHVRAATRIGEYTATARLSSGSISGRFVGVDREALGSVVFWRPDFADIRLGYLTNALAQQPDALVVSREFMESRALDIGDLVEIDIRSGGDVFTVNFQIVGALDYFPRWYPEADGALFMGNLDYLFEQAQLELAHRVIARIEPGFDSREFQRALLQRGAAGVSLEEPISRINREQSRPERQGLFGLLSIGFITSSLATMIGFLLYTIFSYQRRYVELGILRAIGLSRGSMMRSVAWELGLLIALGLALGLGIGLLVSALYIPYMQFVSSLEGVVPPYLVSMAWAEIAQIVALFFFTFVLIMAILLVILRRMRIFQAVKLGETL
ncbi:MAG: FtsX-like permease family protein [Chloroflexi bacterium]|nr:FtsX-like permease family protein [Chloroflexota bacterium]MCY4246876.1 FtsX-like permease family protein [Chloroflexota bacterium]